MKKLLEILKRNTVHKIFSIILAVLLWAYVQIALNPEVSYEVVEVPITITGEADINSEGFVVSSVPKNMKTNVTISATRSKIQLLDTSDLFAFVDISQCHDTGDFNLPVKVRSNDSEITVMNKSPSSISLYIDKIVTVSKPVTISYDGTLNTDYYIDKENINISPESAIIKVPELVASQISEILVSVDMTGAKSDIRGKYQGIALNKGGDEVNSDNLTFVTEEIEVEIPVLKKKVVPIELENIPENVTFTLSEETVELAGPEDKIAGLQSVSGYINDYSNESTQSSYSVTVKIPEGFVSVYEYDITAYPKKIEQPSENKNAENTEKNQ